MRLPKKYIYISLIIFLSSIKVLAEINMRDGSYIVSHSDFDIIENKITYKFTRTYNSRSLYEGHFGKGWCSPVDKAIDTSNPERLLLVDCSVGKSILFIREFSTDAVRQGGPNRQPDSDTVFYLQPDSSERIIFQNGKYTRMTLDGYTQVYNRSGQLLELSSVESLPLLLSYNNSKIRSLKIGSHLFAVTANKFILGLKAKHIDLKYIYKKGLLVAVEREQSSLWSYSYTVERNLELVKFNDRLIENIKYKESEDLVEFVQSRDCKQNFKLQNLDGPNYTTFLDKQCGNRIERAKYEFYHRYHSQGSLFLAFMRVYKNGVVFEVQYHPFLGYPVSVIQK